MKRKLIIPIMILFSIFINNVYAKEFSDFFHLEKQVKLQDIPIDYSLDYIYGLVLDENSNFYVQTYNYVAKYDSTGKLLLKIKTLNSEFGDICDSRFQITPNNHLVFFSSRNKKVHEFDENGNLLNVFNIDDFPTLINSMMFFKNGKILLGGEIIDTTLSNGFQIQNNLILVDSNYYVINSYFPSDEYIIDNEIHFPAGKFIYNDSLIYANQIYSYKFHVFDKKLNKLTVFGEQPKDWIVFSINRESGIPIHKQLDKPCPMILDFIEIDSLFIYFAIVIEFNNQTDPFFEIYSTSGEHLLHESTKFKIGDYNFASVECKENSIYFLGINKD
ncbi:hypothetical protein JXI42_00605, partial [bacterium]|nr:hypothetical protein [bacterium]